MKELYHEEQKILTDYVGKVKKKEVHLEDAVNIAVHYKDLLDQSKVITRISDRLQKKLDQANQKIKNQNVEIQKQNTELEETVAKLVKVTVGKKASRIMLMVAIVLFISEEYFLGPVIEEMVDIPFLDLGIKGMIALFLKFFESWLETYFMNREKSKILGAEIEEQNTMEAKLEKAKGFSLLKSNSAA